MSAASNRNIGVILAAGRGSRMGCTKQLVSWPTPDGQVPLVAAAFDAVRPICDEMVVVLGHEADVVAAALGCRVFARVDTDPTFPMFESIRAGLYAAGKVDPTASIVLQPGDHPAVARSTLDIMIDRSIQQPTRAIVPEYRGRGGHPVLIPPSIVLMLIDADCPNGLGEYWTAHGDLCTRVPVEDASVVHDIDTVTDLTP
jgi:molybdenum cofactor cytidylyltransferase